jgi:NADH:ubiquinone oxidoreductase subunit H
MSSYVINMLITLLLTVLKIVCLLVAIAFFTLAERKIMAAVQRRVGPNVVGPLGLLQPLADGLKLAGKELAIPAQASSRIFLAVAISVLLFALCGWMAIPFGMFDHSEHINNDTVTKILASTDPAASIIKRDWFYMVEPFDMPVSPEDITPDHEISGKCIITYFEDDTCVYLRV